MSTEDIKTKYGIDTTDFKTGIAGMNRALRVLNSDFAANAAAMGDWEKTASGLEARNKTLNEQMDVQKLKVAALQGEYQRFVEEQGASSAAAQNAQIEYNKSVETLNKMQSEVDENNTALNEMANESTAAGDGMQEMGDKTETAKGQVLTFGQVMDGVKAGLNTAISVIAGVAGAVVGLGAAVSGVVLKSSEMADGLVELSDKTGLSTTRLQELAYVGSQVGVETTTITGSLTKLTNSMADAQGGSETAKNAFKTLGVAVTDSKGNLLSSEAVFASTIDALGKIENPAQRDALAMDIFGKSAMELNPLIKTGAEEIAALSAEAHEMGAVVGEDDVESLGNFSDSLAGLKLGLQGTAATVSAAVLPAFQGMADKAGMYLSALSEGVTAADGDMSKIGQTVSDVVLQIAQDMAAQIPQMLTVGLQILMAILQGLITMLPSILPVAIQVIQSLMTFIIQALPMILEAGVQILLALINGIVPMLPMLLDTALQIIVMLLEGITAALPQLIPVIADIIPKIILVLIDNLPLLITAAVQLIIALAMGLVAAIPQLLPYIPIIIQAMIDAFVSGKEMLRGVGEQLLLVVLTAITEQLPAMTAKAKEVLTWFLEGAAAALGTLSTIGKQIVDGVWKGIQEQAAKFKENINKFFTDIVASVKKALGIKSPSTVFAGIGENMALGLGVGFDRQFAGIESRIKGSMGDLTIGSGRGGGGNISLGGITINVEGQADALTIGQTAMGAVNQALLQAQRARGYS